MSFSTNRRTAPEVDSRQALVVRSEYCVIGYPIGHSLSPAIHNRAFRKMKIPARYSAEEVASKDLAKFMRRFRREFAGGNVTIPHKEKVMRFLDELSPEARAIGAVNTIVNRGGRLIGYNTDVFGCMEALKSAVIPGNVRLGSVEVPSKGRKLNLRGKKVIILGAGGAARAVVYGCKKAGAHVMILNRTLSHAKKMAKDFGVKYGALEDFASNLPCDIIINTTSVGMKMKSAPYNVRMSPLPQFLSAILRQAQDDRKPTVMDIIYRPRITKLLCDARRTGCKIVTGDHMFMAQAERSRQLWIARQK